jgi:hypothetical protein
MLVSPFDSLGLTRMWTSWMGKLPGIGASQQSRPSPLAVFNMDEGLRVQRPPGPQKCFLQGSPCPLRASCTYSLPGAAPAAAGRVSSSTGGGACSSRGAPESGWASTSHSAWSR